MVLSSSATTFQHNWNCILTAALLLGFFYRHERVIMHTFYNMTFISEVFSLRQAFCCACVCCRKCIIPMFCRLKDHENAGSKCASCGLRACICCLWCLENFIKFINHNAYTVIAMEGSSFCTSAKIVSDMNEKKHIYIYICYIYFLSVSRAKDTKHSQWEVSSDTYSVVLK